VELHVGDRVRLRAATTNAPTGTEGQVFGVYRRGGRVEVVVALNGRVIIVDKGDLDLVGPSAETSAPES
jgi:hypothetical protein